MFCGAAEYKPENAFYAIEVELNEDARKNVVSKLQFYCFRKTTSPAKSSGEYIFPSLSKNQVNLEFSKVFFKNEQLLTSKSDSNNVWVFGPSTGKFNEGTFAEVKKISSCLQLAGIFSFSCYFHGFFIVFIFTYSLERNLLLVFDKIPSI